MLKSLPNGSVANGAGTGRCPHRLPDLKMNIPAPIAAVAIHRGNESFMQPSLPQRVTKN